MAIVEHPETLLPTTMAVNLQQEIETMILQGETVPKYTVEPGGTLPTVTTHT